MVGFECLRCLMNSLICVCKDGSVATIQGRLNWCLSCSILGYKKHDCIWLFMIPTDSMNAYAVVGPMKLHPRFLRSLDIATDSSDFEMDIKTSSVVSGVRFCDGSHFQKYFANGSPLFSICDASFALFMTDSILPRCRTMPGLFRSRCTSASLYVAILV